MAGLTHSWPPPRRHAALLQGRREKCSAQSRLCPPGCLAPPEEPRAPAPPPPPPSPPTHFQHGTSPSPAIKPPQPSSHTIGFICLGDLIFDSTPEAERRFLFFFNSPCRAPPPTGPPTACSAGREPGARLGMEPDIARQWRRQTNGCLPRMMPLGH